MGTITVANNNLDGSKTVGCFTGCLIIGIIIVMLLTLTIYYL
jgi:hypothetical protein